MGWWAQYYPPAIAAIGTAMYGIDTGIIATTIGHQSFNDHMFPPTGKNPTLIGESFSFSRPLFLLIMVMMLRCCIREESKRDKQSQKLIRALRVPIAQEQSSPSIMLARQLALSSQAGRRTGSAASTPSRLHVPLQFWEYY